MSCERFRNALTEVAAGEPAAPALDAHLAGCDGCRKELAQLRQLMAAADESLSALATAEPSPALRVRIREAAMLADPGPTPLPPWRWGWAWPVAAAAVLALAAVGAWREPVAHAPVAPLVAGGARPAPSVAAGAATAVGTRPSGARESVATAAAPTADEARSSGIARVPTGPNSARRSPVAPVRASAASPRETRAVMREAEVLVPAGQQEALLQFVALVHREGLHVPTLAAAGQPSADLAGPAAIDIRPLEIVPLDPAAEAGTD